MAIFAGGIAGLGVAGFGKASGAIRLTTAAQSLRNKGMAGNVPGFTGSKSVFGWGNMQPLASSAKRAAQSRLGQLAVGYAAHEAYQTGKKEWNSQRRRGR